MNWSHPYQGLDAHIERYRNSPVMHEDVPDEYKPMSGPRIPPKHGPNGETWRKKGPEKRALYRALIGPY